MPDTSQKLFPITTLQDLCYFPCFRETKIEVPGKIYSQRIQHWSEGMRVNHRSISCQCPFLSNSPSTHKITDQSDTIWTSAHAHSHLLLVSRGKKLRDEIAVGALSAESQSKNRNSPQLRISLQKCAIWKEMQIRVFWGSHQDLTITRILFELRQ